jgi:hypothetical protein
MRYEPLNEFLETCFKDTRNARKSGANSRLTCAKDTRL